MAQPVGPPADALDVQEVLEARRLLLERQHTIPPPLVRVVVLASYEPARIDPPREMSRSGDKDIELVRVIAPLRHKRQPPRPVPRCRVNWAPVQLVVTRPRHVGRELLTQRTTPGGNTLLARPARRLLPTPSPAVLQHLVPVSQVGVAAI